MTVSYPLHAFFGAGSFSFVQVFPNRLRGCRVAEIWLHVTQPASSIMSTLSAERLVTRLTSLKIILGLVPVALLVRFYAKWRQLRHVPGPFWWSITPLPNLMVNLKGVSHEVQDELVRKYGKESHCFVEAETTKKSAGRLRSLPERYNVNAESSQL